MTRTPRPRIRKLSIACAAACLGFLLPAARALVAQSEIDEALRLAREGQEERAEEIVKRIVSSPSVSDADRTLAELVRAEAFYAEAALETKLERHLELLARSIQHLRSFLQSDSPPPRYALEARRALDGRLHRRADRVARASRSEPDARRQAELHAQAEDLYRELARHLRSRIQEAEKTRGGEGELLELRIDLAKSLLELAQLPAVDRDERRRVLKDAIDRLQDMQYDYSDHVVSFEALWLEGQAQALSGEFREAEDRFGGAIHLRQRVAEPANDLGPYHLSIIRGAALSLAELFLESGRARDAAAVVESAFQHDRALAAEPIGLVLKLAKADALFQLGDAAAAHALASEVIQSDKDGRVAAAAKEKRRRWSLDAGSLGGQPSAERLLLLAELQADNEDWQGAIQSLRSAIDLAKTPDEVAKTHPEAYYRLGQCYTRLGRRDEAVGAFESLFKSFPEHDLAPRACFEAVSVLGGSDDSRHRQLKEQYLELLVKQWPAHPAARNVAYLQAEKLEREQKLGEAAKAYLEVPEDADAYENALVGAARCLYGKAAAAPASSDAAAAGAARRDLEQAAAALRRFFERAANPALMPKGAQLAKLRAQLVYQATQQQALIDLHDLVQRPQDCLVLLERYQKSLADTDPKQARIAGLKVRALVALKRVDDAEAAFSLACERFPEHAGSGSTARLLAYHLEQDLDAAGAAPSEAGAEKRRRIHRYSLAWLKEAAARGQKLSPGDVLETAETLFENAGRLNGLDAEASSFLDVRDAKLAEPERFKDLEAPLAALIEERFGALDAPVRLRARLLHARCLGFSAANADEWSRVKDRYEAIVESFKLVDARGQPDFNAFQVDVANLLAAYLEFGGACLELARGGQVPLYETALGVFQNVQALTDGSSKSWWLAQQLSISARLERASAADKRLARAVLANLEKNYPNFDDDKFRLKAQFIALKQKAE
jgi:TolA-binding protein